MAVWSIAVSANSIRDCVSESRVNLLDLIALAPENNNNQSSFDLMFIGLLVFAVVVWWANR